MEGSVDTSRNQLRSIIGGCAAMSGMHVVARESGSTERRKKQQPLYDRRKYRIAHLPIAFTQLVPHELLPCGCLLVYRRLQKLSWWLASIAMIGMECVVFTELCKPTKQERK
eukprot:3425043-Amphidinium_carterae.2